MRLERSADVLRELSSTTARDIARITELASDISFDAMRRLELSPFGASGTGSPTIAPPAAAQSSITVEQEQCIQAHIKRILNTLPAVTGGDGPALPVRT